VETLLYWLVAALAGVVISLIGVIFRTQSKRIEKVDNDTKERIEIVDKRSEEIEKNYIAKFKEVHQQISEQTVMIQEGFKSVNKQFNEYIPRPEIFDIVQKIGNHVDGFSNEIKTLIHNSNTKIETKIDNIQQQIIEIYKEQRDE